jgi:hypothetical protein
MTATTPHVLIVTAHPDCPTDPDLYHYDIECPGVSPSCRAWTECTTAGCNVNREYNHDTVDALGHGQPHRHIHGTWMVEAGYCYVQSHDGMPDAVAGRFGPGRHLVGFDIDVPDDGDIQIFAVGVKS